MTLKASSNKFHPAFRLYKYSVKRTMGITVLLTVFFLLILFLIRKERRVR